MSCEVTGPVLEELKRHPALVQYVNDMQQQLFPGPDGAGGVGGAMVGLGVGRLLQLHPAFTPLLPRVDPGFTPGSPRVHPACFQTFLRLKLKYVEPLSNLVALWFGLRAAPLRHGDRGLVQVAGAAAKGGRCG